MSAAVDLRHRLRWSRWAWVVTVAAFCALPAVGLTAGVQEPERILPPRAYALLASSPVPLPAVVVLVSIVPMVVLVVLAVLVAWRRPREPMALLGSATLVAAAAFVPLRRTVQDAVDRRFNRARYDAARVADRFGATLRDDVDLDALTTNLHDVVASTVQPVHVSLWLPTWDDR